MEGCTSKVSCGFSRLRVRMCWAGGEGEMCSHGVLFLTTVGRGESLKHLAVRLVPVLSDFTHALVLRNFVLFSL